MSRRSTGVFGAGMDGGKNRKRFGVWGWITLGGNGADLQKRYGGVTRICAKNA